ncbi:acyl-CoA synthetases (AMP-forming)/AMP-acid ligases II [Clostridium sp. CAG:524]|nr:acyl-CoA synthetases (AMP-forming)/AMP-acid ligases II [Clostridium sp. CAG:524]
MQESKLMSKEEKKELKKQEKLKKIEEKNFKKEIKKEEKLNKKNNIKTPWLKYYKEGVPAHLNYPKGTMVGYFLEAVARYPENIAIEYYGRTYTYRAFYEMIRDTAKSLKSQGVKEGDTIAICMPNTPEAILMFYAANMVGALVSLIHPLSAEKEIQNYINGSGATFLLSLDLVYDKVHNIVDNTCIKKIVIASAGDSLKTIKKFLYKFKNRGTVPKIELTDDIMTWNEFINYGYDYQGEIACLKGANDPAVILYSGGTSGDPKGILLTNMNFNALALSCHKMIEQSGEGESILAILPIFHGFGLGVCIHTTLGCGMRVVLVPNFNPKDFGRLLHKHKISIVCGVPSLFESLTKTSMGKNDLSKLKSAISGGDFMSKDLKNKVDTYFREHGSNAEIRVGYGLTEASAAICVTPTGEYRESSIGVPFPDTYIKVVRVGTHDEVPYGEDGEICISGPTVMMGYLNNLEETIQTLQIHEDGRTWLHTGDVGSMDKDGFVYFKQRVKRIIISNGYNLYPSYIETIINSHPDVFTSTVIGIPHPKKVQVAKAYIVLKDGVKPSKDVEKSIRLHCEKNLARYSLPAVYEFRESLPKTLVGKVAYRELEKESK